MHIAILSPGPRLRPDRSARARLIAYHPRILQRKHPVEGVGLLGTPFVGEFLMGLADAVPIALMMVLLGWTLAPVAALLIALGTFAGVLVTVFDGGSAPQMQYLLPMLPAILLMAALNAFLEGVICRNAICGPLRGVLPTGALAFFAGVFSGVARYYGAPGGVAGVMLASVLAGSCAAP